MNVPIKDRHPIPKIKKDRNCKAAIHRLANEPIEHIKSRITSPMDLTEINQLIYATASAIADKVGAKPKPSRRRKNQLGKRKSKRR